MKQTRLNLYQDALPVMISLLKEIVMLESPSPDKVAVDRLGQFLAAQMGALEAHVERYPQPATGDHWLGTWGSGKPAILLLAHMDTVHPIGTLERMPWKQDDGQIHGPGVLDMKASIAMALTMIQVSKQTGVMPNHKLSLLCTSDEETSSSTSRELIEAQAIEHDLVLCLEPALPNGSLKTQRKGISDFQVEVIGVSSHAGASPEEGVNAIHEMAAQVENIAQLADPALGSTVSTNVIQGGTRTNVIPERCRIEVDIRIESLEEAERIENAIRATKPHLPGAAVQVSGGLNRPPMHRDARMIQTFHLAQAIAAEEIGLELSEGATGGGSDANFVAPLGIPVLDGLGAIGHGAHSADEYIRVDSLVERTALLNALNQRWPADL